MFLVRPKIIEAPQNANTHVGGRMTLRCRADGFPAPFLAWTVNGNPTPTTFVHDISRDGTELLFMNVSREDQGTYKCVAQNSAGAASASALLTVYDGTLCFSSLEIERSITAYCSPDSILPRSIRVLLCCSNSL